MTARPFRSVQLKRRSALMQPSRAARVDEVDRAGMTVFETPRYLHAPTRELHRSTAEVIAVTIPQTYRGAFWSALVQTGIIIVFSALAMDFGETLRVNLVAVLLFWGWILIVMYRRPDKPMLAPEGVSSARSFAEVRARHDQYHHVL